MGGGTKYQNYGHISVNPKNFANLLKPEVSLLYTQNSQLVHILRHLNLVHSLKQISILSSHPSPSLPNVLVLVSFQSATGLRILYDLGACYKLCSSHTPWFDCPKNIWRRAKIMKALIAIPETLRGYVINNVKSGQMYAKFKYTDIYRIRFPPFRTSCWPLCTFSAHEIHY
jgi:hypothetical protein